MKINVIMVLLTLRKFASEVLCHNPPLPGLPDHALPISNHDRTDHNTKPTELWHIPTVAWSSYYYMT